VDRRPGAIGGQKSSDQSAGQGRQGGIADWTEGAGQSERSSIQSLSERIGEKLSEAIEGIRHRPRNGPEFERIAFSQDGFLSGENFRSISSLTSSFRIIPSFQRVNRFPGVLGQDAIQRTAQFRSRELALVRVKIGHLWDSSQGRKSNACKVCQTVQDSSRYTGEQNNGGAIQFFDPGWLPFLRSPEKSRRSNYMSQSNICFMD
jgi:hypothetical protein